MKQRVFTYITRKDELLVFDYVDKRYPQPQIPGGTIVVGEPPPAAALREAREETGLKALKVVRLIGDVKRNATVGRAEVIHAWFFHLETTQLTELRWRHFETDPANGTDPIELELYWVPLSNVPALGGLDGLMLDSITDPLRLRTQRT